MLIQVILPVPYYTDRWQLERDGLVDTIGDLRDQMCGDIGKNPVSFALFFGGNKISESADTFATLQSDDIVELKEV